MTNKEFFNGKTIWITGASSGIGEALALQLSGYNTQLILSSRRRDELERVKSSLHLKPENIFILPLDLNETATLEHKSKEALAAFGKIDILINNGGISQRSLILETNIETDRKIMEINYFSGIIITKNILPAMLKNGSGHIVTVSSLTGKFGFPLRSAYAASKHAIVGFYESLQAEYFNKGIHTTVVFPGQVRTKISFGALGPDGQPQNISDPGQENGISAEKCANDILNGIRKDKREVNSGGKELLMLYIKRFIPWLAYRLARKVKRI